MKKILYTLLISSTLLSVSAFADQHQEMSEAPINPQEVDGTVLVGGGAIDAKDDIATNVMKSDDFSTLVEAVVAADLGDTLMSTGPFTVFAPVNMAFDKLADGTVETLLIPRNKDMLTDILTYHVVAGTYSSNDLKDGLELTTVQGERITFTYYKKNWYVNNALIEMSDMYSSNGVIHSIDSVLMPKSDIEDVKKEIMTLRNTLDAKFESRVDNVVFKYNRLVEDVSPAKKAMLEKRLNFLINLSIGNFERDLKKNADIINMLKLLQLEIMYNNPTMSLSKNIVETAMSGDDFSTLVAGVVAADLGGTLSDVGPFTVFAPTNTAFEKLPDGAIKELLLPENKKMLTDILTYHVVSGTYLSSDIQDGTTLKTVNGERVTFSIKNGVVTINDSVITMTDMKTSNGVIHAIDRVLSPSK